MGTSSAPTNSQPREIAVTSVKVERELHDRFKALAVANRRSFSQQLRWEMERAAEAFESEQVAA